MTRTFSGLGPDTLVPQPKADVYTSLRLGPREGFVLSRVDGRLSVAEICLLVPFDAAETASILAELARVGAIAVPGVAVAPAPTSEPMAGPTDLPPALERSPSTAPSPPLTDAPIGRAAETVDGTELTLEQARRIDEFFGSLDTRDAFGLLELPRDADKRAVKRAYFKMSKEFHPDRYFGKSLGPYGERLSRIFQSIKAAFELLSDDERRAAYLESMQQK